MSRHTIAIARAVAIIGGTGALIIGATFAAGSVGSVSLTANTFAASQGLLISNGGAFGDTATGFNFGTVSIGATGSPHSNFFLEDTSGGTSPLDVTVTGAHCGAFTGLDQTMVHVNIEATGGSVVNSATLAQLCGASATPFALDATNSPAVGGASTKYDVWMSLDSAAITGSLDSSSNGFDLDFTGTPAS